MVLWQHVVFLCVCRTVFRMGLVMVVHRMLCSLRPISRCTAHDAQHNQAHSKHRTTHTQKHDMLPQHQS